MDSSVGTEGQAHLLGLEEKKGAVFTWKGQVQTQW